MTEPVLGWRIWKLREGQLASWAMNYCWEPGGNRARCLTEHGARSGTWHRACEASPGRHCQCGFWAVWSPLGCVARAHGAAEPPWHVMGLIAGWGTVAMHGREGFRAEWAAMMCLFTDWSWSASQWQGSGGLSGWWRRTRGRAAEPEPLVSMDSDLGRGDALREVAARYGVPLVSLRAATSIGLLSEWGIPPAHLEEARRLGTSTMGEV